MIPAKRIDIDGYFVEDVLDYNEEDLPSNLIMDVVPEGLYKPKWDGTQWVEGKPQDEIDLIKLTTIKAIKRREISDAFNGAVEQMVGNVMPHEIASWRKQEDQARAWLTDNSAPTPTIDGILQTRNLGETKEELVAKIIANADAYEAAYAPLLGKYQSLNKSIDAATLLSELDSIVW